MHQSTLDAELAELESAEDFLDYFGIEYDPHVVQVNRLHILQRFHDYLTRAEPMPTAEELRRGLIAVLLERAYRDFLHSDARTEKVFRVFHKHTPQTAFVPLASIGRMPAAKTHSSDCGCGGQGVCHSVQGALSAS